MAASIAAVAVLLWKSESKLTRLIEMGSMSSKIDTELMGQPTCVTVEVPKCGSVLNFYQRDGELMAEFTQRIQTEVAIFKANWGDK